MDKIIKKLNYGQSEVAFKIENDQILKNKKKIEMPPLTYDPDTNQKEEIMEKGPPVQPQPALSQQVPDQPDDIDAFKEMFKEFMKENKELKKENKDLKEANKALLLRVEKLEKRDIEREEELREANERILVLEGLVNEAHNLDLIGLDEILPN